MKYPGIVYPDSYSGSDIANLALKTFGKEDITPEQLNLLMDYMVPSRYILRNHSVRSGRQPFTFSVPNHDYSKATAHRNYGLQIANDLSKNLVVIKSRQLGFSELMIAYLLWWADSHSYAGPKCLYTFPTLNQMQTFTQTRLDPVISSSAYYKSIMDDYQELDKGKTKKINSVRQKKLRNTYIIFRSSSTPKQVEGVDADIVFMDEYDRVNPLAEESIKNNITSSKFQIFRRWSTPTVEHMGVSAMYERSDQMCWLHKCPHCGKYNDMSFNYYDPSKKESGGNVKILNPDGINPITKTVVPGSFQYVCKYCGKPLDRWYDAEWIPKYPDRNQNGTGIRGYKISQMDAVWISADQLKQAELSSNSKSEFYNYSLGMPYTDEALNVTPNDIYSNGRFPKEVKDRDSYKLISVGIDWGTSHNIVVMGMKNNGDYDVINSFTIKGNGVTDSSGIDSDIGQIRLHLLPYEPDIIIADIGDAGEKVNRLIEIYGKDRVFGCKFTSNPRAGFYSGTSQLTPSWNENNHIVTVDKLTQNKRFINAMKTHKIGFWKNNDNNLKTYISHWENVVIRMEEQDDGSTKQVIGRKGPDHRAQASVYANLGLDYLKEKYYGEGTYPLDYHILQGATKTDINSQFNSKGIFNPY